MKRLLTFIVIGTIALVSCSENKKVETPMEEGEETTVQEVAVVSDAEVTKKVIEHHLQAFGEGNMEALMMDYTDESVVLTPDGALKGLAQIQELFEKMGPMFPKEGTEFVLDRMDIDNELGYIVWHANTPVVEIPLGTDSYIVQNGKIMKQTFAAKVNPVAAE